MGKYRGKALRTGPETEGEQGGYGRKHEDMKMIA